MDRAGYHGPLSAHIPAPAPAASAFA